MSPVGCGPVWPQSPVRVRLGRPDHLPGSRVRGRCSPDGANSNSLESASRAPPYHRSIGPAQFLQLRWWADAVPEHLLKAQDLLVRVYPSEADEISRNSVR